jgi:hypothetical protein
MGQPITVVQKDTPRRGIVRFELNRSVTGMDHERYSSPPDAGRQRPSDELARRLFAQGDVASVSMYSNEVIVELVPHGTDAGLLGIVESLYTYYLPGVTPSITS